jgi:hypothetical protein
MIVDGTGKVLSPAKQLPDVVLSTTHSKLRYNPVNGLVYWAAKVPPVPYDFNLRNNLMRLYAYDPRK